MTRATEKIEFEVYKDVDKQWRSRLIRVAFGRRFIITDGGEGYRNKNDIMDTTLNIIKAVKAGNSSIVVTY